MSTTLIVNNKSFEYPTQGQEPGWGEPTTEWAQEVSTVLGSLAPLGSITTSTFSIINNQTVFADIVGLVFTTGVIRGAEIDYTVYRATNSNEAAEYGKMYVVYNSSAGTWSLTREYSNDGQIDIEILNNGQMQYKSSNLAGTGYSGTMKFKASVFGV
jgi:hypothetical protein